MVPPLERVERRDVAERQGGEFVEAYVAKCDAKNPLQIRKQLGFTRIWPCYIRLQEGDCRVESGEFAETQVQRPPDQNSSISRIYRLNGPSSRKV